MKADILFAGEHGWSGVANSNVMITQKTQSRNKEQLNVMALLLLLME